jgi:hypothetical protein
MSAHSRTSLQILSGGGDPAEVLRLEPSDRLQAFLDAAAARGLNAREAVRLGLERALCLRDGARFAADVEAARHILEAAAARARPTRGLPPGQAAYLRALGAGRPVIAPNVSNGISVEVPEKILGRVEGTISQGVLHERVVEEMVAWEVAATLAARTMGEWALLELLGRAASSAGR